MNLNHFNRIGQLVLIFILLGVCCAGVGCAGVRTTEQVITTYTPDETVMTNKVTMDYTDTNGHVYPQQSSSATTTVTAAIMTIEKVADVSTADPGDVITYTITDANTGNVTVDHIVVTEPNADPGSIS